MSNINTCNECGEMFDLVPERFHKIHADGLTVEYFDCPFCLTKYHIFTADNEMMELVDKRKGLAQKIKLANLAKARHKTILGYHKELEKVKKQQFKLSEMLSARGVEILNRQEAPEPDIE